MTQIVQELPIAEWPVGVSDAHQVVNGITIHRVEAGSDQAPVVILLHGFADFWWGWRRQVGHLAAAGFRVVAPDQRGYNLSGKPLSFKAYDLDTLATDIVALADFLGRNKFYLIGHDLGGLVGWWIATRYPDRIERFIAINSFHPQILLPFMRRHPTQMLRSIYMAIFQIPWLPESLLRINDFAILRRMIFHCSQPGTFSPSVMDAYKKAWTKRGALTGMINWYRALRRKPYIPELRVLVPTLVIWGDKDIYLDKGLAHASLALCSKGSLLSFENGTHFVHVEEPDAVNAALVTFLQSPPS